MNEQTFKQGFEALTATFPGMNLNSRLYWMTLKDLDGKYFLNAVYDFIKTTAQVYPGTNIIALIREKAEQQAERDRADKAFKLTAESDAERMERWKREAAPMPDEARKELDKLGIRITQQ